MKWYKAAGASDVYQKLNRTMTKDNWPAGGATANTGSPSDVSGRYILYQYIPSAKFTLNPTHGWAILSAFKENYRDSSGTWRQDPTWSLGCNNFSGSLRCSLSPSQTTFSLTPYMDRWVRWEYRLYQGDKDATGHGGRIELYADDNLLDTGYNVQRRVGSAAFSPLSDTLAFVWIAGQYTSDQGFDFVNSEVTSYVGPSAILPLP